MRQNRTTPDTIVLLQSNEIFIFGANEKGHHGKGAARTALNKFGAKWGCGDGLQGRSYGISTKDRRLKTLSLDRIQSKVQRFIRFAAEHPELHFLVTAIGCGLAGYQAKDIAPMFKGAPENVSLPQSFWDALSLQREVQE